MFFTLIDGTLLNITKVATISFDNVNFKIFYRMINGSVKEDSFDNNSDFSSRVEYVKSKLVMK